MRIVKEYPSPEKNRYSMIPTLVKIEYPTKKKAAKKAVKKTVKKGKGK